jgi:peptide/nickel transport system substrate-binding protein
MSRIARRGGGVLGIDESSTVAVDDHTVEITPARPNRRLVQQLNHPQNSIVAPNTDLAEVRIGTGPYKEVEYTREDHYTVEAYEGYWGEKQQVGRLTFRFYPDAVTRALALQSGEVDIALLERQSAPEFEGLDGFSLVTSQVGAYEAIYINIHGAEPYDLGQDPAIREALAYAIDKQAIIDGVWEGYAEINTTMIPPRILGDSAGLVQGTAYDPEKAKELLETAGWTGEGTRQKDGRDLKLTMVVGFPDADTHGAMPELVQAQLEEVGIALELVQTPDTPTYEARLQLGEGDLWAEAGSQNDGNPCFLPDLLFYSPPAEGDPESMMYGAAFAPGPDFDAHIDMCRDAVEVEAVQEAAANAMKVLIDEQHVVIPLAGTFRLIGVSDRIQGLEAHPSGVNQTWGGITVQE